MYRHLGASPTRRRLVALGAVATLGLLAACGGSDTAVTTPVTTSASTTEASTATPTTGSVAGSTEPSAPPSTDAATSADPTTSAPEAGGEVTLVTHDSFNVDKKVLADFEAESGITVTVLAQGDSGAMVNQLVLTKDNPLGDVVFGIDNAFASRALDADVLAPYTSPLLSDGAAKYAVDDTNRLTAVDFGDVCVNVDHRWFAEKKIAEPVTFEDLAKPEYKDLLVTPSPATSSPGLAFLLATVDHFGADGWQAYWESLKANGVKVTSGWSDAYSVDFSGSSGKGARPLVLSYASSPPYEVTEGMTEAPTGALLDTCFRQVEYAGVLAGAKNPAAAAKVVDFLLSPAFQADIPTQMYVYPVSESVDLPADWVKYATPATSPATLPPADITANRETWIQQWSDLLEG